MRTHTHTHTHVRVHTHLQHLVPHGKGTAAQLPASGSCRWGPAGRPNPGLCPVPEWISEQFVMTKHHIPFISGQGFLASGQLIWEQPQLSGHHCLKIKAAGMQALIKS